MKSIYDYPTVEILEKCVKMTKHDIERHIKKGVQIYTISDYLGMLEDNGVLQDELESLEMTKEEYAEMLKNGYSSDIDAGTWNGLDYVIVYCL